jgi:phosphatidylglycerophosphate synthase
MNAPRELTFLLAGPERRLLRALASRLPATVRPNHLTVLGVLAALGTGAAYALSVRNPAWLWVASLGLALNWVGDSLDGTLARVRGIERPRYGYYLDHLVDAVSVAAIGTGIGLSPYVDLWVALGLVVGYLMLSINIYLETTVFGVFELGYGRVGPTETRLMLIGANTLLAIIPPGLFPAPIPTLANAAFLAVLIGMALMLLIRVGRNLAQLGRLEPGIHKGPRSPKDGMPHRTSEPSGIRVLPAGMVGRDQHGAVGQPAFSPVRERRTRDRRQATPPT